MNDLGETMDNMGCVPSNGCDCQDCKDKQDTPKIHYPRESFTTDQLHGLDNAKLGDTVKLVIEAEVVGVRSGQEYEWSENENKKNETKITLKLYKGTAQITGAEKADPAVTDMKANKKDANDFGTPEPSTDSPVDE